jgi:hypothetical protein
VQPERVAAGGCTIPGIVIIMTIRDSICHGIVELDATTINVMITGAVEIEGGRVAEAPKRRKRTHF